MSECWDIMKSLLRKKVMTPNTEINTTLNYENESWFKKLEKRSKGG